MHIKTSTWVAAGILAVAGTPLALHLAGGTSKNGSPTSWIKKLHGGGSGHGSATPGQGSEGSAGSAGSGGSGGSVGSAGSGGSGGSTGSVGSGGSGPQSISDLTGKWVATIDSAQGPVESAMSLKQDGRKITGTFANPHGAGEFPIQGERKDNELKFSVDGKTDHGDMHLEVSATIKKEDGSIVGMMTSSMGELKFMAKRAKG